MCRLGFRPAAVWGVDWWSLAEDSEEDDEDDSAEVIHLIAASARRHPPSRGSGTMRRETLRDFAGEQRDDSTMTEHFADDRDERARADLAEI